MMSSYYIVQAIWMGVLPMLAAAILVGALCYLLCCLNAIKVRIVDSRKRKRLRRETKRIADHHYHHQHHQHQQQQQQPAKHEAAVGFSSNRLSPYRYNNSSGNNIQPHFPSSSLSMSTGAITQPIKIDTKLVNDYKPVKVEAVNVNESSTSYAKSSHHYHHHHNHPHHHNNLLLEAVQTTPNPSVATNVRPNTLHIKMTIDQQEAATVACREGGGAETGGDGGRKTVKRSGSDSEIEQLVVQELNESPKSSYSRLQNLIRRANGENKNKSGGGGSSDNKTMASRTILQEKQEKQATNESVVVHEQHCQSSVKTKVKLKSPQKEAAATANSDVDANKSTTSSSSKSTSTDTVDNSSSSNKNNNNTTGENDYESTTNDDDDTGSSTKHKRINKKKTRAKPRPIIQDEKTSLGSNKAKLVELSKPNQLNIDIEDDLIFADEDIDDDSLSSTGLCVGGAGDTSANASAYIGPSTPTTTGGSTCLIARLQRTAYYSMKCSAGNITDQSSEQTIAKEKSSDTLMSCSKCAHHQFECTSKSPPLLSLRAPKKNFSSMSDIEPDENMVKDMLVKAPKKQDTGSDKT